MVAVPLSLVGGIWLVYWLEYELSVAVVVGFLALAGVASGFLNVMAGGGSLLTVPIMLFMGVPGPVANGTNRIAIFLANLTAIAGYQKGEVVPWRRFDVSQVEAEQSVFVAQVELAAHDHRVRPAGPLAAAGDLERSDFLVSSRAGLGQGQYAVVVS